MNEENLQESEILRLIRLVRESFDSSVEVYTRGSCIRFALILSHIYPNGKILYDGSHAIFQLGDRYYDITGEVKRGTHIELFSYGYSAVDELYQLKYTK